MSGEISSSGIQITIAEDVEEVLSKEVKTVGNGAHVLCPKEHVGRKAYLVVCKE